MYIFICIYIFIYIYIYLYTVEVGIIDINRKYVFTYVCNYI